MLPFLDRGAAALPGLVGLGDTMQCPPTGNTYLPVSKKKYFPIQNAIFQPDVGNPPKIIRVK
jgi:hypothetical protein